MPKKQPRISALQASEIARRRDLARMSQEQLADAMGMCRSTVQKWEQGKRRPTRRQALRAVAEIVQYRRARAEHEMRIALLAMGDET